MNKRIIALGLVTIGLIGFGLIGLDLIGSSTQAAPDRTGWPKELTFGVIPAEASQEISTRFKPLVNAANPR